MTLDLPYLLHSTLFRQPVRPKRKSKLLRSEQHLWLGSAWIYKLMIDDQRWVLFRIHIQNSNRKS